MLIQTWREAISSFMIARLINYLGMMKLVNMMQ
jgi:hypothetical protein